MTDRVVWPVAPQQREILRQALKDAEYYQARSTPVLAAGWAWNRVALPDLGQDPAVVDSAGR